MALDLNKVMASDTARVQPPISVMVMATPTAEGAAMDSDEGAAMTLDSDPVMATNMGMGTDTATAMDFELASAPLNSDTAPDSNTAFDTALDTVQVQPLGLATAMAMTTVTSMDSEEGADTILTLDMDQAKAPDLADARASSAALVLQLMDMGLTPSQALASQSDDDGSRDLEQAAAPPSNKALDSGTAPDLNTAPDMASDTAPIQSLALATTPSQVLASQSDDDGSRFPL